jgi:hypothetical protein
MSVRGTAQLYSSSPASSCLGLAFARPCAEAEAVVKAGEEREKKEAASRVRLENGELGLDIYGMRRALDDKGLKYVDGPLD